MAGRASSLKVRVHQLQQLESQTIGLQCALTRRLVNDSGDRRGEHPTGKAKASAGSAARIHPDDGLIALMQSGGESIMEVAGLA
jgi:hypothetical protein